jgi:hypothetical protein
MCVAYMGTAVLCILLPTHLNTNYSHQREGCRDEGREKGKMIVVLDSSIVDPDRVGSASFCRIRIEFGIQGMPIRIGINAWHMKKLINYTLFPQNFKMLVKLLKSMPSPTTAKKMKHCKLAKL